MQLKNFLADEELQEYLLTEDYIVKMEPKNEYRIKLTKEQADKFKSILFGNKK